MLYQLSYVGNNIVHIYSFITKNSGCSLGYHYRLYNCAEHLRLGLVTIIFSRNTIATSLRCSFRHRVCCLIYHFSNFLAASPRTRISPRTAATTRDTGVSPVTLTDVSPSTTSTVEASVATASPVVLPEQYLV